MKPWENIEGTPSWEGTDVDPSELNWSYSPGGGSSTRRQQQQNDPTPTKTTSSGGGSNQQVGTDAADTNVKMVRGKPRWVGPGPTESVDASTPSSATANPLEQSNTSSGGLPMKWVLAGLAALVGLAAIGGQ